MVDRIFLITFIKAYILQDKAIYIVYTYIYIYIFFFFLHFSTYSYMYMADFIPIMFLYILLIKDLK